MPIKEYVPYCLVPVCALLAASAAPQSNPVIPTESAPVSVINIDAAVSGYYQGVITSPLTRQLSAGCYSLTDASGKNSGASFDAFNYHLGVANDWAWQYRVVDLDRLTTLSYVAAPSDESPATKYAAEAGASAAGLATPTHTFCTETATSVGFMVDDNYVPDNTGGISLFMQGPMAIDQFTLAGPSVLSLGDREVEAWEGYSLGDAHPIYFRALSGSTESAITQIPGLSTTVSPALASAGGAIYVATLPANFDNMIVVTSDQGSTPLCDSVQCARSKARPALVGAGSALYAAWTDIDGTIRIAVRSREFASAEETWRIAAEPVPNATTGRTNGPALAFFHGKLILAWTSALGESIEVNTTSHPLSSDSWSSPTSIASPSSVAPALGTLYDAENHQVLDLAWTTPAAGINFAQYEPSASTFTRVDSPFELPSGALTTLTPSLGSSITPVSSESDSCLSSNYLDYTNDAPPPTTIRHKRHNQHPSGCP